MMALGDISSEKVRSLHSAADVRPTAGRVKPRCLWMGDDYQIQLDRWANEGGALGRQKAPLETTRASAAGPGGRWS